MRARLFPSSSPNVKLAICQRKHLTMQTLPRLGSDRLTALLLEVSTGSAEIKRRLRLELSHTLSPQELGCD